MEQRQLTKPEREFLTKRHYRKLWGQKHLVTPALVDEVFGDGEKLICLMPTMTRPNYYVVQVDSSWALDNFAEGETLADHLDDIYNAIEEQYGRTIEHSDDCPEDCDGSRKCYVGFPGLNSEGSSWGEISLGKTSTGESRQLD